MNALTAGCGLHRRSCSEYDTDSDSASVQCAARILLELKKSKVNKYRKRSCSNYNLRKTGSFLRNTVDVSPAPRKTSPTSDKLKIMLISSRTFRAVKNPARRFLQSEPAYRWSDSMGRHKNSLKLVFKVMKG